MSIDRRVLPQIWRQEAVVFDRLEVVNDAEFRSAAMNMAIDEALLESAKVSSIRFYEYRVCSEAQRVGAEIRRSAS